MKNDILIVAALIAVITMLTLFSGIIQTLLALVPMADRASVLIAWGKYVFVPTTAYYVYKSFQAFLDWWKSE